METITVTFSLPKQLNERLQPSCSQGCRQVAAKCDLNEFIANAIERALTEEEKNSLEAAVKAAENDPDRNEVIADWESLEIS